MVFVEAPSDAGGPGTNQPAAREDYSDLPPVTRNAAPVREVATLGSMRFAKEILEVVAAIIGIIGGVSAIMSWLG